jgi:hypothetical protein
LFLDDLGLNVGQRGTPRQHHRPGTLPLKPPPPHHQCRTI